MPICNTSGAADPTDNVTYCYDGQVANTGDGTCKNPASPIAYGCLGYVEGISFRELARTGEKSAIAQGSYSIGETLAPGNLREIVSVRTIIVAGILAGR